MLKKPVLKALMASTFLLLSAESVTAETLQQSVNQALAAHPSVEAAMAGKDIAKQDYKEARSGFFPELAANITGGRIFGDNSTSRGLVVNRGTAYSWLGEGSAALTQPVFDGRETANRTNAASARIQSADLNVTDVRENLALNATQAHLAVMQTKVILKKTQSYHGVIEDYLSRIQLMVDEGVADETEVAQAKNILLMLKSTVTDFEGRLNGAYAGYKEIVGHLPKSPLVKPAAATSLIPNDVETAITQAKSQHPLVLAGVKDLEAAGYEVKAERSGYYPDLDGELSYLKRDQKEEIGGELTDARAVMKMSWDFETGGAQKARTKRSKAQYSEILAQNREVMRTIEGDIRRSYAEYATAKQQMELVKKRELVTADLLDAYKTQFEGAVVRLLQIMQAENQLFNAQLESTQAEYRYLLAQYNVLASMGLLLNALNKLPAQEIISASMVKNIDVEEALETIKNVPKKAVSKADEMLEATLSKENLMQTPVVVETSTVENIKQNQEVQENVSVDEGVLVSKQVLLPQGDVPRPKENGKISIDVDPKDLTSALPQQLQE